jgi:hypothetical protein
MGGLSEYFKKAFEGQINRLTMLKPIRLDRGDCLRHADHRRQPDPAADQCDRRTRFRVEEEIARRSRDAQRRARQRIIV